MGLNGFIFSGLMSTHVDMAPNFAGTLMGITNSIGNIPGFIAPMVANAFIEGKVCLEHYLCPDYSNQMIDSSLYVFGKAIVENLVVCLLFVSRCLCGHFTRLSILCFGTTPGLGGHQERESR